MAFSFQEKTSTAKSVQQVAAVVKEVGEDKTFMGPMRKAGVSLNSKFGQGEYGPFSPQPDDDPFASAGREPDWKVGWHWGTIIRNSMGMTMNQGWRVIFDVFDEGSSRTVVAKVEGVSQKGEVKKFVKSVFQLL